MSFSRGHALIIGVGAISAHSRLDVPIAHADAQAVYDVVTDPRYAGYPKAQVRLLTEADTTRQAILDALEQLSKTVTAEDTLLLFYVGHGIKGENGAYYLSTFDTKINKTVVTGDSGVRDAELVAKLRAINAKKILVIINSCHSGAFAPSLSVEEEVDDAAFAVPPPNPFVDAVLGSGEGRAIISACRTDQLSYIGGGQTTFFTTALLKALRGDAGANNGYIGLFELYPYLYLTVKEDVEERINKVQEPELTLLKGVGPFPVALYNGATSLGEFVPGELAEKGSLAVREVSAARSKLMAQQYINQITNTTTNISHQSVFGENNNFNGNITIGGNAAGGNIINSGGGDVNVRNVNTDGGDYAEGGIYKNK